MSGNLRINCRQETAADYQAVFALIERAFENEPMSDHQEQFLVERLRKSDAFVPQLSLVAEMDDKIIGYILLTKIQIQNKNVHFDSLALAPVAVLPEYQGQGIGGTLIRAAHDQACQLGHGSVVLLGHETYYPKFGYRPAHLFGISLPFEVPKENCMAVELIEGTLDRVSGTVVYPRVFFG